MEYFTSSLGNNPIINKDSISLGTNTNSLTNTLLNNAKMNPNNFSVNLGTGIVTNSLARQSLTPTASAEFLSSIGKSNALKNTTPTTNVAQGSSLASFANNYLAPIMQGVSIATGVMDLVNGRKAFKENMESMKLQREALADSLKMQRAEYARTKANRSAVTKAYAS